MLSMCSCQIYAVYANRNTLSFPPPLCNGLPNLIDLDTASFFDFRRATSLNQARLWRKHKAPTPCIDLHRGSSWTRGISRYTECTVELGKRALSSDCRPKGQHTQADRDMVLRPVLGVQWHSKPLQWLCTANQANQVQ